MKSFLVLAGIAVACIVPGLGCASTSTSSTTAERKLTMSKPGDLSLKRGEADEVVIKVWKQNINTDVSVRFDNLPRGVQVVEKEVNSNDNQSFVSYTLSAGINAVIVEGQVVRVVARGPDGLEVTESFEMTVDP